MGKFTEAKLEQVFIDLLDPHSIGSSVVRSGEDEVLIEEDLRNFA